MHPNPAFRKRSEAEALDFAVTRGFGVMTAQGPEGPLASHLPFLLSDGRAEGHFVRSTALARALANAPLDALLVVSGPDGYVSPDWYGEDDKVPTWNYVAVHLRGTLRLAPEIDMRGHVDRLSARFEGTLLPKKPWISGKMDQELMARMMRTIVPWELSVTGVESTFKLNQNRGTRAREGAAAALAAGGTPGMETAALAALMRAADDEH